MKRSNVAISTFFVAGLALGSGMAVFLQSGPETADTAELASTVSAKSQDLKVVAPVEAKINKRGKERRRVAIGGPSVTKTTRGSLQHMDPYAILSDHPPPHVADAVFYGPDTSDAEAEELRLNALEELIETMRVEGLPAEQIDAVVEAASSPAEEQVVVPDDPDTVAPTVDREADELVLSMVAEGLAEEDIAGMVDALYAVDESNALNEQEISQLPDPEMHQGH